MNPPLPFEAWALPGSLDLPGGSPEFLVADQDTIRILAMDAAWTERLAERLVAAGDGLRALDSDELLGVLGGVGARFLDPRDPIRVEALNRLPGTSGLSPAMCCVVLDRMAADWTGERLRILVREAVGDPCLLDGFGTRPGSADAGRRLRAMGPRLAVQVVAGSVPGVGVAALLRSLLVKGPTLVKPGLGDIVLPTLFARALREASTTVADALAVTYWPGGREDVESAALARADVVIAYGGDAAVKSLRDRTPVTARFHGYHHRISVGVVGRGALTEADAGRAAEEVAEAVAMFDQRGCVCPGVVYVEEGGRVTPRDFAERLSAALDALEAAMPSGRVDAREASTVHQARALSDMKAAMGDGAVVHRGEGALSTVIFDPSATLHDACAGRMVRVRPMGDLRDVPRLLAADGAHLQSVGIAGVEAYFDDLIDSFAAIGVSRIVPFTDVAFPPAWWKHDGQDPLAPLLRWVEATPAGSSGNG